VQGEFQQALTRVAITGGAIGIIGVLLLAFAVRAFRGERPSPFRAAVLIAIAIIFVLLCCFLLLRVSAEH
jgi:multisubunit Na+/H+ antiporter MnhB subunit